jgi:outer membrane protein assembly factor BamC
VNQTARLGLLGLTIALSACSVLEGEKIDYKSAAKGSTLEVPPDLSQLSRETRYAVPGGVVSANALQAGQATQPTGPQTALAKMGDVRIERNGNQRWLVVSRPADKLWEPVREFWLENGFTLALDQSNIGIMETDWAENRAKIPQDIIRSTLGKVLDSLYSTGERDKFRTRMERAADGSTEIYVSHRGMIEVFNSSTKDSTVWQPRPADPELETEFLRRMMVKLGVSQE